MKLSRKLVYHWLCISQTLFLLASNSTIAFAASGSTSYSQAEIARLDQFERSMFGQIHDKLSPDTRLKDLENGLFGLGNAQKSAPTAQRLAAISKALGAGTAGAGGGSNLLMPAMAPQMDTSATAATATSMPPAARDSRFSSAAPAVDEAPDRAKELLKQAMTLYSAGKTDQAEQAFKRVLAADNKSVDAYYNLGVIAEGRGDLQGALNNYKSAYRLNPGDNDLREAASSVENKISQKVVADARARQQQDEAAQAARQDQLRASLKPLVVEASTAFKAGNFDKAVTNLQEVARQAPSDPDVQYALAQAYRGKGDFTQAKAALNRAIAIDPNNQSYRTAATQVNEQIAQSIGQDGNMPKPAPSYSAGRGRGSNSGYGSGSGNSGYGSGSGNTAYGSGGSTAYGDNGASPGQITSFDNQSNYGSSGGGRGRGRDASGSVGQVVGFSQDDSTGNGGVTPFTGSGDSARNKYQQGYAFSAYADNGYGNRYGGGGYGGGGSTRGTRLRRAAVSGLAGAAMGAMYGGAFGGGARGGMRGALMGGALGLITGGLFSN